MATVSDINSLNVNKYEQINQASAKERPDAKQLAYAAEAKKKQQSTAEDKVSISREADAKKTEDAQQAADVAKNTDEIKQVADKKDKQEADKNKTAENDSKGPKALIQQYEEISNAGNSIREAVSAYNASKKQGQVQNQVNMAV
ncbi:MAG: hypothetical protein HQL10_10155 [Nitrospirae bacterium]|nr:hypothetical protein [Nitrospirota bacterium]